MKQAYVHGARSDTRAIFMVSSRNRRRHGLVRRNRHRRACADCRRCYWIQFRFVPQERSADGISLEPDDISLSFYGYTKHICNVEHVTSFEQVFPFQN